ncbi:MAG: 30S ribosomal protein S8 [Magnetococcales bacterium]|nr:30S ribosomal protein S8 [Magnetococcales bacterium]
MGMTDPISDMLTRIRNAQAIRRGVVEIPYSTIKEHICAILVTEGYVAGVEKCDGADGWPALRVKLKYHNGRPVIEKIRRCSRPGRRLYCGKGEVPRINRGLGIAILSTSKGVLSTRQAREMGVGGELICTVF